MARAEDEVLVATEYSSDFTGIMVEDFEVAANDSKIGVLVVGPPEIAVQLASEFPQTVVFALKDEDMKLSPRLAEAERTGQLRRLDVDVFKPNVWGEVHQIMLNTFDPLTPALPEGEGANLAAGWPIKPAV